MSAAENVAFPLRVRRVPADARRQRVEEALALVGLSGLGERRPSELSGGQRQRVALARCLAMRPALVLLDEPLANLDAHLREQMQSEIRRIHRDLGLTFLYVTQDQAEAMGLADRVVVMDGGRLQQAAEPVRLYNEPATEMVARFIGRGAVVAADILGPDEDRHKVAAFGLEFRARGNGVVPGAGPGRLCLRPPDLRLTTAPEGFAARIVETRFQGATTMLTIMPTLGSPETMLGVEHRGPAPLPGAEVRVAVDDAWLIPGHPK
jgi:iron(III) transport system ATP-binding protein